MTPYELEMLRSLREEIAFFGWSQLAICISVTALLIAVFIVSHHTQFRRSALIVPFLIASALFAVGRTDLLMHRAAAYIRTLEASDLARPGWEEFKSTLVQTKLLPLYDLLALSAWCVLLVWSYRRSRELLDKRRSRMFIWSTAALVALSVSSIVYGAVSR